jgi:succinoglycan biosynthesis protein ExoV
MKLFYYVSDPPNVGDDINPWLFDRLLPGMLDEDASELVVGIGTILDPRLPAGAKLHIFGTGVRPPTRVTVDSSWNILALRGPLSAQALRVRKTLAVTDPALLASRYAEPAAACKHRGPTFVPHVSSAESRVWPEVCERAGVHYLDPRIGVEAFLAGIASSSVVMAEAMHGAILADSFRVPWIPVRSHSHRFEGEHVNTFKWRDWCESVGVEYAPHTLPVIWPAGPSSFTGNIRERVKVGLVSAKLRKILKEQEGSLSSDAVFAARCDQLLEVASQFSGRR